MAKLKSQKQLTIEHSSQKEMVCSVLKFFGPIKDYECLCGKYKRMKYRGVVCEKCGVELHSLKFAVNVWVISNYQLPVAHIWFLRSLPSRIGNLLGLNLKDVERVLYCEAYLVTDPMETTLEGVLYWAKNIKMHLMILSPNFKATVGGDAV